MKTTLKIVISIVALLLLVVVVGVLWVANIDPNNHKQWLQAQVRDATGYELQLNGNLGFELYPWLTISADDVRLANPPGFGDAPLAEIEHVAFRARLLPLLGRNVEIDTMTLRGLNANLITAADGRSNWATGEASASTADAAPASGEMPFNDLRIGGINIERVNIIVEDLGTESRLQISDLAFTSDELVYGEPINLNLAFAVLANSPALDANVNLNGTVNYDLDNGRYDVDPLRLTTELRGNHLPGGRAEVNMTTALHFDLDAGRFNTESLRIEAPQTRMDASITATDLQRNNPRIESTIAVNSEDLAVLFNLAGIEPLATQLAQLPTRNLSLQSQIVAFPSRGNVEVSDLALSLLGADVSGQVTAENLNSGEPILRGNLRASGPNLPSVMEVIGQVSGGRNSKLAEGGRLMQGLDDKRFAFNADFDADLSEGTVQIPELTASLLSSEFSANLNASALDTDTPSANGQFQGSGDDLAMLVQIGSWFAMGPESAAFRYGNNLGQLTNRAYTMNTAFDVNLRSGAINISQLDARAFGQQLTGNFTAANINSGNGAVNGVLGISGTNLPALLRAIEQPDLAEVAQSVSVDLQFGGTSNNLAINPARVQMTLSGNRIPNSPVAVTLNAASSINIERETVQVENFSLAGLGLDVRGRINGSEIFSSPAIEGAVEIAQFNPRQLLTQLNQPVPDMSDPTALQVFALNTGFSYSATSIALSELAMRLDETNINGEFSLDQSAGIEWLVDVDIDTLNIDRYLGDTAPAQNTATTSEPAPIPVDTVRSLKGRGSLEIGALQVAGLSLRDLSFNVEADEGRINLSPLSSNLYEGSFNGSMSLDASQETPNISVNVALQEVALGPLLTDMMDSAMLSGKGNLQLDVRSTGADTLALQRGLNGTGSINLEDGVLQGVDVASVLGQIETMLRSRSAAQLARGEQTAFESFGATLQFTNGVISSNDLLLKSPGFQVTGSGTVLNLHDDTIDYDLVTTVDAATATRADQQYEIGDYSVPIACSGTIAAPRCLPDAGEIVRNAFANEVRNQVGDLLRRATGTDNQPASDGTDTNNIDADATTDQQDPAQDLINRALNRLLQN
ncbi:MAG: AsmA family protein [Gammaproteobacteria bacterium]